MGFPVTTTYLSNEIVHTPHLSYQIPIVIAAGQTLVKGTVMGQRTTGKQWAAYASAAVDGSQKPWGILAQNIDTSVAGNGSNPVTASMYIKGVFVLAALPAPGVDAAALTAQSTWVSQTCTGLLIL